MRLTIHPFIAAAAVFALAVHPLAAHAQAPAPADPVVARVNGQEIRLSEIAEAAQTLPDEYRNMPQNALFPLLLDQAIDRKALVAMAHKQGLDQDPAVRRQVARAGEQAVQNALVSREVRPAITEAALHTRYDQDYAGKTGEEEVHARHILLSTEAEALKVIEALKKGGDFAAIAKAQSSDPGAAQGGDLGFFKKGDMLPEFAAAAFALKPGEVSDKPVKTQYGWHVIKLEERRAAPAPSFEQVHDELRQKLVQETIDKLVADARGAATLERFNPDGSAIRATDSAEPPPAPKP